MLNLLLIAALALELAPQSTQEKPLPRLVNDTIITGPGVFRRDSPLRIEGHVRLENLTLKLAAPIVLAKGAKLELQSVHFLVSDPPDAANGASNLHCEGPADISIVDSTMVPEGGAHPIWVLEGTLDLRNFQTENSEFHLEHTSASLSRFKIFELEISRASQVTANELRLVFLSTHSGEDEHLQFADIPVDKPFTQILNMGSGARADLADTQIQFFLLYVHGQTDASLRRVGRAQLAFFPNCQGKMELPRGQLGTRAAPAVIPQPGQSNCRFRFTLEDVKVDTWDVYASGQNDLTFSRSHIDELTASEDAAITVKDSELYADWMAVSGKAKVTVEGGTVGALSLAKERPDLATSQIRLSGTSQTTFAKVKFDCGIVASDNATVKIDRPLVPPQYIRRSQQAKIIE